MIVEHSYFRETYQKGTEYHNQNLNHNFLGFRNFIFIKTVLQYCVMFNTNNLISPTFYIKEEVLQFLQQWLSVLQAAEEQQDNLLYCQA